MILGSIVGPDYYATSVMVAWRGNYLGCVVLTLEIILESNNSHNASQMQSRRAGKGQFSARNYLATRNICTAVPIPGTLYLVSGTWYVLQQ